MPIQLDCQYSQVGLNLKAEVVNLQIKVRNLRDQLAVEIELRQHTKSEVDKLKQLRGIVLPLSSKLRTTKSPKNDCSNCLTRQRSMI
jgi:hypothetical protein